MNVIGSRPDGWWRDRDGGLRRLVQRLLQLPDREYATVTLVVDGRPLQDLAQGIHGGVWVLYASRSGPNAADDCIIELLETHPLPETVDVVTSDPALAARAVLLRASVTRAGTLRARLDRAGGD